MDIAKDHPFLSAIVISSIYFATGWMLGHPFELHSEEIPGHSFFEIKLGEFFLVLFTFLLWWATRALVKEAKESSQKELRAYVHLQSAVLSNVHDGHPSANLVIHNYGKTPAYKLTINCSIAFGVEFEDLPGALPNELNSIGTLAPGATVVHGSLSRIALTHDQIVEFNYYRASIFVYGKITYVDLNGKKRFTSFRTFKNAASEHDALASSNEGNESN